MGFFSGDGEVSFPHPPVELNLLFLETPLSFLFQHSIPLKRSVQPYIRWTIEQESDIGLDSLRRKAVKAGNPFQIYSSAIALIGNGSVTEPVAKNNFSLFQEGLKDLFHMLRSGGFVEKELGCRDHPAMVRVQKDFSYFLPNRTPPRLSGYFTGNAFLGEILFKALDLRGFATPLHTLKSNEERQRSLQ
jgi:hypothetical protein